MIKIGLNKTKYLWKHFLLLCCLANFLPAQTGLISPYTGNTTTTYQAGLNRMKNLSSAKRVQLVKLNKDMLNSSNFLISFFEDNGIKCAITSRRVENGAIILTGKAQRPEVTEKTPSDQLGVLTGEVIITIVGDDVLGKFSVGAKNYNLARISEDTYTLTEIDLSKLPPCGN